MKPSTIGKMFQLYPSVQPPVIIEFEKTRDALTTLLRLDMSGELIFADGMAVALLAELKNWQTGNMLEARITPKGWGFLVHYSQDIKSIRLKSELPLSGLMSRREKKRREFARPIIDACYEGTRGDIESWGCSLVGNLDTDEGLHQIRFTLWDENANFISNVILDGWSGQIIVGGKPLSKAYSNPEEVCEIIRESLFNHFENITSNS